MRQFNPYGVARYRKLNLVWKPLPYPVRGLYFRVMTYPIVMLHQGMGSAEERCVLTEEIGHYFLTSGNYLGPCFSLADLIVLNKEERSVLRWAADRLISDRAFARISKQGDSIWELAEHFEVTPRLIVAKYEFMQLR